MPIGSLLRVRGEGVLLAETYLNSGDISSYILVLKKGASSKLLPSYNASS